MRAAGTASDSFARIAGSCPCRLAYESTVSAQLVGETQSGEGSESPRTRRLGCAPKANLASMHDSAIPRERSWQLSGTMYVEPTAGFDAATVHLDRRGRAVESVFPSPPVETSDQPATIGA